MGVPEWAGIKLLYQDKVFQLMSFVFESLRFRNTAVRN